MRSQSLFLHLVLIAICAVQFVPLAVQGQTDDIAALKRNAEQGDAIAQYNLGWSTIIILPQMGKSNCRCTLGLKV
jgi:hypothetical protein